LSRRKKPAGVARKVYFDPELDALLQKSLGRRSMSDFVNDAVAQRLSRWESPADFVRRKRDDGERDAQTLFDLAKMHESGWPAGAMLNPRAEINYALAEGQGSTDVLKARMQVEWSERGLGEYTEAHLQETLRWHSAQAKTKPKVGAL